MEGEVGMMRADAAVESKEWPGLMRRGEEVDDLLKGHEVRGVPEVDLAGAFSADRATRRAVAQAMVEAWRTWGAFLVVNHGVAQAVVESARDQAMRVFSLPMAHKLQAWREPGTFAGYGNGAGSRTTHSTEFGSESFRIGFPGPDNATFAHKLWPENSTPFRERNEAYIGELQKLSLQLVELLSEGLPEEDRAHINGYFLPGPGVGSVRVNYYPASTTTGLPPHTDAAAFVLLHQSDEGLQVEKDDQWVTVQARNDALVVVMGTIYQCQIFTNGEYKAGRHRAVKGGSSDRLSMVFSMWPLPSLPITPAPSFLAAHQQRLLYKPLTFEEFWEAREADLLNPLNCVTQD